MSEAALVSGDDGPVYPNGDTGANVCRTVTVKGKVFYNDLRSDGRWSLRLTPSGAPGARNSWAATGATNKNHLGLLDGQVASRTSSR